MRRYSCISFRCIKPLEWYENEIKDIQTFTEALDALAGADLVPAIHVVKKKFGVTDEEVLTWLETV